MRTSAQTTYRARNDCCVQSAKWNQLTLFVEMQLDGGYTACGALTECEPAVGLLVVLLQIMVTFCKVQ